MRSIIFAIFKGLSFNRLHLMEFNLCSLLKFEVHLKKAKIANVHVQVVNKMYGTQALMFIA